MKTPAEQTTAQTLDFNADALDIACGANTLAIQNRRGIGEWTDASGKTIGFYVYDNHPYIREQDLRDRNYAKLIAFMTNRGCRLAGCAHYPSAGKDAGYTFALIMLSAALGEAPGDLDAARKFMGAWTSHFIVERGGQRSARIG